MSNEIMNTVETVTDVAEATEQAAEFSAKAHTPIGKAVAFGIGVFTGVIVPKIVGGCKKLLKKIKAKKSEAKAYDENGEQLSVEDVAPDSQQ